MKTRLVVSGILLVGCLALASVTPVAWAEPPLQGVSPTPVPINLSGGEAQPQPAQQAFTPTPTRTPTPVGPALLEAITEANVRAEPDLESERLGTIRAGETYTVLGRYFRWLQFQYNTSPTGLGWVYDELVNIIGDAAAIPDLGADAVPTVDTAAQEATARFEAITQTPGGILTATAEARLLPAPGGALANPQITMPVVIDSGAPVVLPTFTYPPDVVAITPTLAPAQSSNLQATPTTFLDNFTLSVPNQVPPLVLILALGGMGLFGLLVSLVRR